MDYKAERSPSPPLKATPRNTSRRAPRPVAVALLQILLLGYVAVFCYINNAALIEGRFLQSWIELSWQGRLSYISLPLALCLTFVGLCLRWRLARWLAIGLSLWLISPIVRSFYWFIAAMQPVGGGMAKASIGAVGEEVLVAFAISLGLYFVAFAPSARRFFGVAE